MHYHVFVCHADEDKPFARQLTQSLRRAGAAVWFDEDEIRLGTSIRQTIDRGLTSAEYGLVVLSKSFFSKKWANRELNGLVAREMAESRTVVLPVWYELTYEDVTRHSPTLADQRGLVFDGDFDDATRQILERLELGQPYRQIRGSQHVELLTPTGDRAIVTLARTVQVGVNPLTEMHVRIPESTNYELQDAKPGRLVTQVKRLGGRWVTVEYDPPLPPGHRFTQSWDLVATNEYDDPENAVGVNASKPYDAFNLSVATRHPGSIGNPRAVVTRGDFEIPLPGVSEHPDGSGYGITIDRPEVGVGYALYWDLTT